MMSGVEGISAFPSDDNIFLWVATVQGAEATAYQGLEFQLRMQFSANYPFEPPVVSFVSPCFHPNVDAHGTICLDILKENWTAVLTASQVLLSIQSLLDNPNNASPLNAHAAALWADQAEFRRAVLTTFESRNTTIAAPS